MSAGLGSKLICWTSVMNHYLTSCRIYSFAWIYGFVTSSLVYYVINKWISPQNESLVEEAVYPPQKGEVTSPSPIEGEVVEDMKVPVSTTKEEV